MPFTLSHPLFAAPLKKIIPSLSVTGLILGSMAPDIEYFFAMQPLRTIGHELAGFFLLGLPVCTAFAFAFHLIMKQALLTMLPSQGGIDHFAAQQIHKWDMSTPKKWASFIISLFIGFQSHLFMDNLTHSSGFFVDRLPLLRSMIFGEPVYHLLQLSLSVLGLLVPALLVAYRWNKWRGSSERFAILMRQKRVERLSSRTYQQQWLLVIFFSLLLFSGKLILSGNYFSLSIWIVAPITSVLFGLYVTMMLRASHQFKRTMNGILYAISLFAAIGLFKLLQHSVAHWTLLWIVYTWVISALVLASSLQFNLEKR